MATVDFMLQDLVGTVVAFFLFPLFLLIPGYVLGWLTDALGFRKRLPVTRVLLALVLSIAVVPIATYLVARFLSFGAVWYLFGATWLGFLLLMLGEVRRPAGERRLAALARSPLLGRAVLIASAWTAFALLLLIDLQWGENVYFNYMYGDYGKHVSVTDAITRTGVPPANPSFFPGEPVSLYYYYFWFMLCSLVDRLSPQDGEARMAVLAGTVWAGLGLMAIVALWVRHVLPGGRTAVGARATTAIALLLVSGLDVVPVLMDDTLRLVMGRGRFHSDLESWNGASQVTAWAGAVAWVPHHIAALVAGLTGLLLLRAAHDAPHARGRAAAAVLASFSFASAAGLSTWVTVVFAACLGAWILVSLWNRWASEAALVAAVGVGAAILAAPYLLDLRSASQISGMPVALAARDFDLVGRLANRLWGGAVPQRAVDAAKTALLPVNYFLELGLFMVAPVLYWKARRKSGAAVGRADLYAATLLFTSGLACSFVKSNLLNNDFGWRGFMPAQFVLLLWSVDVAVALLVPTWLRRGMGALPGLKVGRKGRAAVATLFVLGLATSIYGLAMLRWFPILTDSGLLSVPGWTHVERPLGLRTHAMREAHGWIREHLPASAVVQHNPVTWMNIFHELYGDRQTAAAGTSLGTLYGIPQGTYDTVASPLSELFMRSDGVSIDRMSALCERFSIDALVVQSTDPIWNSERGWSVEREPVFDSEFVKVFECGSRLSGGAGR